MLGRNRGKHGQGPSGNIVRSLRKSGLLSSMALIALLSASSGAWAQCKDNFAVVLNSGGVVRPAANALPLGTGTSVSALVSTMNTVNTAFLTTTSAFVSAPANPQPDQLGGGVWGRGVTGATDISSSTTGTIDLSKYVPSSGPTLSSAGTSNCNATTHQEYSGYQVGTDISILNHAATGANWHLGVTAGEIRTTTLDTTRGATYSDNPNAPGQTFVSPPGDFSATTQVPFIGVYSAFTQRNFFADGQVRWDFYQNSLTDANNGLAGQGLNARSISVTGNAGYNIPLHHGWFIEPSGGVVWSRMNVDPLSVPGVPFAGGGFTGRGTLVIDDIDSILGRATLRVGTSFAAGQVTLQPYFTASIFHEFAGDVTSRSTTSGNNFPVGCTPGVNCTNNIDNVSFTSSTNRVGTYGQFGLGTAAVLGNSGWLGYARADYRVGENIEGYSVTAGLRWQFNPVNAPLK